MRSAGGFAIHEVWDADYPLVFGKAICKKSHVDKFPAEDIEGEHYDV
jgi:hypothetical protein